VDEEIDAWLAEEFDRAPVAAGALGLTHFYHRLDDLSAARFQGEGQRTRRWMDRFRRLAEVDAVSAGQPRAARPTGGLSAGDRIDVELALCELGGRQAVEGWEGWRRDPAVYLQPCLNGIFGLFLHRLAPEADLVAAAVSRLRQIPTATADAVANLDPEVASPLLVERGVQMARAGASYLRELLPAEVGDPNHRSQLAEAGAQAAVAVEGLASHLAQLGPRCGGDWALGEDRYSEVLRRRQLLAYGGSEVERRGELAWAQLDEQMNELARTIDPEAPGWRAVTSALAADHPADPDAMRLAYEEETAAARRFCFDRQLVTPARGERCIVAPSPVFVRPVLAVASYQAPPPLTALRTGYFYVPYPPEGTREAALAERLADNGRHAIPSVSVHEAYPGHHWHLTWSASTSHPVRHWVRSSYFVEGWALYAEKLMCEEGYFVDPRDRLLHLAMRIFRAVRMIVDPALHAGSMSPEEAERQLVERAGMTEAVARAEVNRYCAWPTQAPSYLTGALEIEALRDRWRGGPGGGRPLREFHDTIASSPGLPLRLAARTVSADS
jgi:uncharacterized protein (DUF885 family)